jgi:undecaprenyl-diphosphatase
MTTTTSAVPRDVTGTGRAEEATHRYHRSPRDVLRLVIFGVATLGVVALTKWAEDSLLGLEQDVVALFTFLSPSVERIVAGAMTIVAAIVGVLVFVIPIVLKRYRLLGYVIVANLTAMALMGGIEWWLDRDLPTQIVNDIAERAGISTDDFPSTLSIAQLVAAFVVLGPFVSRRWRRAGALTIAIFVLVRLIISVHLPANVFIALPLGAMVGAGVLYAFGRPDRRPTPAAITAALRDAGLDVVELHAAKVDARGSTPYFGTLDRGPGLFVKVLGEDERSADLLFRVYRYLRLKNVGDTRPFSSLRRTVEHEALVALQARDVGIRTPRLRGVVDVGADSMLLAYDMINGRSVDGLPDDEVTDTLMVETWELIAQLRRFRIAHRDLRRANVFVATDGTPWLIDFGFSELAASDELLDADVAQMLASFAVIAGGQRTVATAIAGIGRDPVAAALPRLQMAALSGATQTALKEHKGLLEELRAEVIGQCGVEDVHYEDLERVDRHTILTIVLLALVTYFLIPQLTDVPGAIRQIRDANWAWMPAILTLSALTYVAATISFMGAVPERLRIGPTAATQLGSSFASKLAPAGLGGMALNVRYLQKQGVDEAVGASAVGLNAVAGFIGHVTLLGVFFVWAGPDAFGSFKLPDPEIFLIGIAVVLVLALIMLAIPATRRLVRAKLLPILARAFGGISTVLRRPSKLVLLIGGSVGVTLSYLVCTYFSLEAFGGGLPFATVGAVYLAGSAVATAAPTPGGLGAMEAALLAGLVAAGIDNTVALPAVFLFRIATFWLPILPGWLCFTWLRREEYI